MRHQQVFTVALSAVSEKFANRVLTSNFDKIATRSVIVGKADIAVVRVEVRKGRPVRDTKRLSSQVVTPDAVGSQEVGGQGRICSLPIVFRSCDCYCEFGYHSGSLGMSGSRKSQAWPREA